MVLIYYWSDVMWKAIKTFGISISEEFGQKISLYDLDILDRDATDLFLK